MTSPEQHAAEAKRNIRCFDELPKELRDRLRTLPVNMLATDVWEVWKTRGLTRAHQVIDSWLRNNRPDFHMGRAESPEPIRPKRRRLWG